MPGYASDLRVREFRRMQTIRAVQLPAHPYLKGCVDWAAVIEVLGTSEKALGANLAQHHCYPQPGEWLLLRDGNVVGWASTMDGYEEVE